MQETNTESTLEEWWEDLAASEQTRREVIVGAGKLAIGLLATGGVLGSLAAVGADKVSRSVTNATDALTAQEEAGYNLSSFPKTLRTELQNPFLVKHPSSGQAMNVIVANFDAYLNGNHSWIVVGPSYGSVISDPSALLGEGWMAKRIPDFPFIFVDYFGRGGSDPLRPYQKEAMAFGLGGLARDTLKTLRHFTVKHPIRGNHRVEVKDLLPVGNSMGGGFAVAMTLQALLEQEFEIAVKKGIAVEPVNWGLPEDTLMRAFVESGGNSKGTEKPPLQRLIEAARFLIRLPERDPGFVFRSAIVNNNLPQDLDIIMAANQDIEFTVIRGNESLICPPALVDPRISQLNLRYGNRIQDMVLTGVGHKISPKYSLSEIVRSYLPEAN